ncbi:MAG: hypothetical protein IMW89_05455 [Ktedonobacteraceae bacterium]|nr:hypothetical protein [Ktedonobacteraceae bacterium]
MRLRDVVQFSWRAICRRFWLLLCGIFLCICVVLVTTFSFPPLYQAVALLMVNDTGAGGSAAHNNRALMQSYALLVTSDDVLQATVRKVPGTTIDGLRQAVSAEAVVDTQLLIIRAQAGQPRAAASIANEVARTFIQVQKDKDAARLQSQLDQIAQDLQTAKRRVDLARTQLADLQAAHASNEEFSRQRNVLETSEASYTALLTIYRQVQQQKIEASNLLSISQVAIPPHYPMNRQVVRNILIAVPASALLLIVLLVVFDRFSDSFRNAPMFRRRKMPEIVGTPEAADEIPRTASAPVNAPVRSLTAMPELLPQTPPHLVRVISADMLEHTDRSGHYANFTSSLESLETSFLPAITADGQKVDSGQKTIPPSPRLAVTPLKGIGLPGWSSAQPGGRAEHARLGSYLRKDELLSRAQPVAK